MHPCRGTIGVMGRDGSRGHGLSVSGYGMPTWSARISAGLLAAIVASGAGCRPGDVEEPSVDAAGDHPGGPAAADLPEATDEGLQGEECAAALDPPVDLFNGDVSIAVPQNIALEHPTPFLATNLKDISSACDTPMRMSVMVLEDVASDQSLDEKATQMLGKHGFTDGTIDAPEIKTTVECRLIGTFPPKGELPAATVYAVLERHGDRLYFVIYRSSPEGFAKLLPSFRASADSMIVRYP